MLRSVLLSLAIASCLQPSADAAGDKLAPVSVDELARNLQHYEGKRVLVHACLFVHRHGIYIAQCNYKSWRDTVPAIEADERSYILTKAYAKEHADYAHLLEADFSGVVSIQVVKERTSHSQLFFKVDTIEHAHLRRP